MSDDLSFLNNLLGGEESSEQSAAQESIETAVAENETTETPTSSGEQNPPPAEESKTETPQYNFKDDFIKGVVEFYEKTGDITPYLQAKSLDFTSMTDEEIMRRELREQYSELSDKAFDKLFKQEVLDKYKLDPEEWNDDEVELGRELLKVQASKARQKYLEWQKNFQAPEPVSEDDGSQELLRQFEESVKSSDVTKKLLEARKISIQAGEDTFNFEVPNAEELIDMTINNDKFFGQFSPQPGQLDYDKWYKTVAYSQNPEMFEKALINYGKTLGRNELTKDLKNPSTTVGKDVPTEASGDFATGLLNAFLNKGVSK